MNRRKYNNLERKWDWYKEIDEKQLYYWAGLLDGEGCLRLSICNKVLVSRISLKMTCEKTVKKFSETFKCSFGKINRTKSIKSHYKDQYCSRCTGFQAAKLAEALLPYLITKEEDAKIIANHYKKECLECKNIFWSFNGNKFCCDKCRDASYNKKRKNKRHLFREKNPIEKKERLCSVPNCCDIHYGQDLCRKHYRRKKYAECGKC